MSGAATAVRTRVIGVGSPAGDDRVGWLVLESLYRAVPPTPGLELCVLDRPGADLVRHFAGADRVIIVDAVLAGAEPGSIHEYDRRALAQQSRPLSAHAVGVADALALALALGEAPRRLHLLGVQALNLGALDEPHAETLRAVPGVVARIRELLLTH